MRRFSIWKKTFPYLGETKSGVINFASEPAGLFDKLGQSSMRQPKGIRGMSRVAAAKWGEFDQCECSLPACHDTWSEKWKDEYQNCMTRFDSEHLLKRFADPEKDIGRVCVFLASDGLELCDG